jgi:hypothetical protein
MSPAGSKPFSPRSKTHPGRSEQPPRYSPTTNRSPGKHQRGRHSLRHRLRRMSWPRRAHINRHRSLDVSARFRSHISRGSTVLRSRIVLDCKEWNSAERDARVWKSRIGRPHLEFSALSKDSSERPVRRAGTSIRVKQPGSEFISSLK